MKQYMTIDAHGRVDGLYNREDGEPAPDIEGFEVVECPAPMLGGFPDGPTPTSVLHFSKGALLWVETASLEALRDAKRLQINAWKLEANNTYFDFAGKRIAYLDADRIEIQGINNVVMLTGAMPAWADWPAAWKTMDNTWTPIPDVATWTAFNVAIGERGTAHFKRAQELKAALALATTPADIDAITW